jgi:hypothetical protein
MVTSRIAMSRASHRHRHLRTLFYVWVVLLAWCSASAQAQLVGSDVRIDWIYPIRPTIFKSATKSVGPSSEVSCPGSYGAGDTPAFCQEIGGGPFSIDINDSSVVLSSSVNFWTAVGSYNGFRLTFASGTPRVVGVSLVSNNPAATSTRLDFTANSISFNLQGLDRVGESAHYYRLNISFAGPPVPVPTVHYMVLLILAGLVLLTAVRLSPGHLDLRSK